MLDNSAYINMLKSISIVASKSKRNLLVSSETLCNFQTFLEDHIRGEVLVVSTNIGMEVFYLSELNYSQLIEDAMLSYAKESKIGRLKFKNNADGIAVYESFAMAIKIFTKYPQVFLAYSKKFLFILKKNNEKVRLTAILSMFYHVSLKNLNNTGTVPHLQKIESLCKATELLPTTGINDPLQEELAKALITKVHSN